MDVSMYEAQADTISVDDIATNSNNRIVLRRLRRNDADDYKSLYIQHRHFNDGEDCTDYVPEGAHDMGWLGYFIGKNEHLQELCLQSFTPTSGSSVRDVIVPFLRGVSNNKSIRGIYFNGVNLLGGEMFTMMGPFFKKNHNLTNIIINNCDVGDEGGRLFALAIGSCEHKSLQKLDLYNNNIAEEGMVDIITSLSMHPHLKRLDLRGNHFRKNGCVALATLLQSTAKELQFLYISNIEINDEGIEALVPALTTCSHLKQLNICENPLISTRGWQRLASILEAPNSNLVYLYISRNNIIDDDTVASFANALTNNRTLQHLDLDDNPSITDVELRPFSKVLCDASSVNSTFLSNHTLTYLGDEVPDNAIIGSLLDLNERDDKKEVAMIKIFQCHNDFDMLPLFEWEFKCLPIVLDWLERASECEMPENFEPNIERRKLSTIYQFVRGMPVLYVETRLRKELEDIKSEESQMEEKLGEEHRRLLQEFEQRKQYLQQRKESIMKNLGVGGNLQTLTRKRT